MKIVFFHFRGELKADSKDKTLIIVENCYHNESLEMFTKNKNIVITNIYSFHELMCLQEFK